MSYLFKARARKKIKKSDEGAAVLRKLRSFLDRNEPRLVYWLVYTWRTQGEAVTYKELREAILSGALPPDLLGEWQQDYAAFVRDVLYPEWMNAMDASTAELEKKYPDWHFDPMAKAVRRWVEDRSATFITRVTQTQVEGVRSLIFKAGVQENMSVDQLARAIRPMVGLTQPQAVANMNYYLRLVDSGVSEEKAQQLSAKYAGQQHRYRAYNIARTELAFSYNQGSLQGTKQAQEAGYMGETVKIWSTAADENVCPICGDLDGKTIGIDEKFDFKTKLTDPDVRLTPPAHPSCRCAIIFEEVAPPTRSNATLTTRVVDAEEVEE